MEYLRVTKVRDVHMYRRGEKYEGTLHLTTHHIIFTIEKGNGREFWFCYPMIERVEFYRGSVMLFEEDVVKELSNLSNNNGITSGIWNMIGSEDNYNNNGISEEKLKLSEDKQKLLNRGCCLRIQFRDFNYIAFDFKNILKGQDVFDSMMRLSCIDDINKLYAFIYQPVKIETGLNGWESYDFMKEFTRQGLMLDGSGDSSWRITNLNNNFELCDSYPSKLIVPSNISDNMLKHSVKYRSKNRFPALTYYYKKNGCSIVRCSQPLVGIKQNRSVQDEKLIEMIFKSNNDRSPNNLIVDCRPITNAMAQVALGAGTEIMDNYIEGTERIFLNIENIHVIRDALNKIKSVLKESDVNKGIMNIDSVSNGWLEHIRRLLNGTNILVNKIHKENNHLIVHCSDGWDRTSQISSLVEICIDPYYRTIKGFIVLIEKEWNSFGHRFRERNGYLQNDHKFYDYRENGSSSAIKRLSQRYKHSQTVRLESPVFQQFLHCIYCLIKKYPNKFEFNERFLRRLVYHLHAAQYGTFLSDNEQMRIEGEIEDKTVSVWDYFNARIGEFTNKEYQSKIDDNTDNDTDKEIIYPHGNDATLWLEIFGIFK